MKCLPLLALLLSLAACSDDVQGAETYRSKLEQRWQELKDHAVDQRDVVQQELSDALARLDRDIRDLERRTDEAGESAKAKIQAELAELRAKRKELEPKLEQLKQDGAAAWDAARDDLVDGMQSIETGIEEAWGELTE